MTFLGIGDLNRFSMVASKHMLVNLSPANVRPRYMDLVLAWLRETNG